MAIQRFSSFGRAYTLLLSVLATTPAACKNPLDALAECPGYDTTLAADASVDGVDPAAAASSLFGTRDGVLPWTAAGASSPVHVAIAPAGQASTAKWNDCDDPAVLESFSVPVAVTLQSDDALLEARGTAFLAVSATGAVPSQTLTGTLLADGDAGLPDDASASPVPPTFDLTIDDEAGAPLASGQLQLGATSLATLTFTP